MYDRPTIVSMAEYGGGSMMLRASFFMKMKREMIWAE